MILFAATTIVHAATATHLGDFEGIEEPELRYIVASEKFVHDDFVNIRDVGENTVRMTLRYHRGDWWDSDRDKTDTSRQRAEVKGLGPHQKPGDTFEYRTTWRTNETFRGTDRFCHVFQLKATDGDNGAPLVVISVLDGTERAALRYWSGTAKGFTTAREFSWKPGAWQTLRIRIKTTKADALDGEVTVSVDGDEFQGARGIALFRPDATDYRPKWGFYRGMAPDLPVGEDWVEHRDASAKKI